MGSSSRRGVPTLVDKNCIILNTKGLCLLCFEECPANLIDRQRELKETSVNFTRLVSRYLGFSVDDVVDEPLKKVGRKRISLKGLEEEGEDGRKVEKVGFEMCDRCAVLAKDFCHLQFQLSNNQMMLEHCVKSITGIIKEADRKASADQFKVTDDGDVGAGAKQMKAHTRLSAGGLRSANILRNKLYKKSIQKLSKSFPRIKLKKICKSGDWIPILNRKREGHLAKENSHVIFASLLGCIVSFWIVISLSFLNPEEIKLRNYVIAPPKEVSQGLDDFDLDCPTKRRQVKREPTAVISPAKKSKSSRLAKRNAGPGPAEVKADKINSALSVLSAPDAQNGVVQVNPPKQLKKVVEQKTEDKVPPACSVNAVPICLPTPPPSSSSPVRKAFHPVQPSNPCRQSSNPTPHQSTYIPRPTPHYPASMSYYDSQSSYPSGSYNTYTPPGPSSSAVPAPPQNGQSYSAGSGQTYSHNNAPYDSTPTGSSYNYNYNVTNYSYNSSSWSSYNTSSAAGTSQYHHAQGNAPYDNYSTDTNYYNYDYTGYHGDQSVNPSISSDYQQNHHQQQTCVQYPPPAASGHYQADPSGNYYSDPSYTNLPPRHHPQPLMSTSQPSPVPMDQDNPTGASTSPSDEPSLTCEDPQLFDVDNASQAGEEEEDHEREDDRGSTESSQGNQVMFPESHWRQAQGSSPPISCQLPGCAERFATPAQLKLHLLTHGQFHCSFCHLTFTKAHNLAHHEKRRHCKATSSGGKIKCPRCDYTSSSQYKYFIHFLGDHLNLAVYDKPCELCNKPFILGTKSINRRNHFRSYHDPQGTDPSEMFPCKQCPALFLKECQLKDHAANHCPYEREAPSDTESVEEISLNTALATAGQIVI